MDRSTKPEALSDMLPPQDELEADLARLAEIQELRVEIERLRAALKRFGNHQMTCSYFRGKERGTCDCGFDKALARPGNDDQTRL